MSKFEKTNFLNNFGSITAFGSPLWKPGLDVDLKKGDNVNSPKSGRIAFAGENAGFGNQVKVVDKRGNEIWLSHLDKINVKAGDNIQAGQKIGLGGNTGKTIPGVGGDGSHLDITVKKGKNFLTAQQAKKYVDFEPVSSFIDNKNLNQQIDQARKLGKTDTEILDFFGKKNKDVGRKINNDRSKFGKGGKIDNDRDLLNFLSIRASGKTPTVESVPIGLGEVKEEGTFAKVAETGKEVKTGIFERIKERGANIGESLLSWKIPFTKKDDIVREELGITEQGAIRTGLQIGSESILIAGDVFFEVIKGLGKSADAYSQGKLAEGLEPGVQRFLNDVEAIATTAPGVVLSNIRSENPELADTLEQKMEELITRLETDDKLIRDLAIPSAILELLGFKASKPIRGALGEATEEVTEQTVKTGLKGGALLKEAGEEITGGIKKATPSVTEKAGEVVKFGVGQATGLQPKTITELINNPKKFTKEILDSVDRDSVAKRVKDKIDARLNALKDTGKGYNAIRESDELVKIPEGQLRPILNKHNINLDVDGKIVTSPESIPLTPTDRKALQQFIDDFGAETELSANSFLNARQSLSNMSAFETGKSSSATTLAKDLRKFYDNLGKEQLTGLKQLDNAYSAEVGILKQIKKDYFTKTGDFKDGAVNKIANLGGTGKQQVLDRLKQIVPDIEDQLNVLKVVEDIEYASGRAVGTYARSIIGAGGAVTGNVPVMVAAIVATPKLAVPLLRKFGTARLVSKVLVESTIKSLKNGTKLVGAQIELMKNFFKGSAENVKKWVRELGENEGGFTKLPGKLDDVSPKGKGVTPEPLAKEARKFKSAEEFVKDNDLIFQGVGKDKKTSFFTNDIEVARGFAKQPGLKGTGEIKVARFSDLSEDARTLFSDDLSRFSSELAEELKAKNLVDRPLSKKEWFDVLGEITTSKELPVITTLKSTDKLTDIFNQAK